MLKDKDIVILKLLRKDARAQLTCISESTGMPITTVFDRMRRMKHCIIKNATLFDFAKINYPINVVYAIKVEDGIREKMKETIAHHKNVNNIYRSSSGFSFVIEGIFADLKEAHDFSLLLDSFRPSRKVEHQVIQEIKKEEFFTD